MSLTPQDIDAISGLVMDLCGVYLDASKSYLIEARLKELVQRSGCANYVELAKRAKYGTDPKLARQVVDVMTTHETLFFRDNSPFDALRNKALPEVFDRAETAFPARRVRIWSAACSTGQEPYSIAMTIRDLLPDVNRWDISILATDVSDAAVQTASRGVYQAHEIERGLPPLKLQTYFQREGGNWKVRDEVRAMVAFKRFNLLDPFTALGTFDIIFCRNVAIYFTPEARKSLFLRMADVLHPAGYIFTGSSELLSDLGPRFQPQHHCRAVFYRPNLPAPAPARL